MRTSNAKLRLLLLVVLAAIPKGKCYQRAKGPRLDNLTESEAHYAKLFWRYRAADRVLGFNGRRTDHNQSANQAKLGYRFVIPLPERHAGITYVGHAARLRLVLERARQGEALVVGALGGSITFGQSVGGAYSTYASSFVEWLNAALPPLRGRPNPLLIQLWLRRLPGYGPEQELESAQEGDADGAGAGGAGDGRAGDGGGGGAGGAEAGGAAAGGSGAGRSDAGGADGGAETGGVEDGVPETATAGKEADSAGAAQVQAPAAAAVGGRRSLHRSGGGPGQRASRRALQQEESAGVTQPTPAGFNASQAGDETEEERQLQHEYLCGAVPGTQSGYMSSCFHHHLPPGVDLVLLEYAANDSPVPSWTFGDAARRAMERLIRKVLRLPSKPAVLLVNMYAHLAAHGRYWYNAERDFNEMATYYGLPSVSLKAAVIPAATTEGAAASTPAVSLNAIFNGGKHHPGRGGHVVVTELLITLSLELLLSNCHLRGRAARCPRSREEALDPEAVAALRAAAQKPLPPPLSEGNYEAGNTSCFVEQELKRLARPPVVGWKWTDEGRGKWGWVAKEAGQEMRFQLNTQLVGNRSAKAAAQPIIVQLAYLQSYSGMGTARVSCEAGCSCEPMTVDAYDPRMVSVTSMKDLQVTQHPDCILVVKTEGPGTGVPKKRGKEGEEEEGAGSRGGGGGEIAPGTSVGDKFKLLGIVIGEEPGADKGSVTWVRPETFELSQVMHEAGRGGRRRRHQLRR